jgi:GDP-L-fucose synthase
MILNNSKILVTGGTGFLGFNLITELLKYTQNIKTTIHAYHDLCIKDNVNSILNANHDVDLIIHLAASVGGIGANQDQPGTFFYNNMMMGLNILEGARKWNIPKVIMAGTVCSYPKYTMVPFKDVD